MDQNCKDRIISEDYASLIIKTGTNLKSILTHEDYCIVRIDNIYSILYTPINRLPKNLFQIYGYEFFPTCFGLLDISSIEASGISKVRNIPGFELQGQGVLIGFIETGIEYTHQAFKNADGTTRILSIWDQTIQLGIPPEGFFYGTEYSKEELNLALLSDEPLTIVPTTDENGHGTMLAGTAAGSANETEEFSGVVPNAEIVVVKLKPAKNYTKDFFVIPKDVVCYEETDILMGINYLLDIARRYARPICICIGLGTFQGAHDEYGVTSAYISAIAERRGVGVVVAGGNEGNRGNHYMGTVERDVGYDTVELQVGPNETGFSMELWGNIPNSYSIDILSPTGEYIPRIPPRLGETREISFIFEESIINVDYELVESQTGDPLIFIRFRNPQEGIWRLRVYATGDLNLTFHIWLPIHDFLTEQTHFVEPNPEYTITSPGNTYNPIVVTTYDYVTGSLFLNAGIGFTRNNNISPSFAAPGVNMIVPAINNGYKRATGSSIAAAHTAGVAAMLLEWGILRGNYTNMNTIEMKNILIRGTSRRQTETYPNKEWGYGILDIYGAFQSLREG